MSFALNVRPEAELDIATAFAWYESELSGLGVQFLEALDDAFEKIAEHPLTTQISREEFDENC